MLGTNLLLINTILTPLLLAVTASRMCDIEQAGNTYTWIFTMQLPETFLASKLMAGGIHILIFDLHQTIFYVALNHTYTPGWNFHQHRRNFYRAVLLVSESDSIALHPALGLFRSLVQHRHELQQHHPLFLLLFHLLSPGMAARPTRCHHPAVRHRKEIVCETDRKSIRRNQLC